MSEKENIIQEIINKSGKSREEVDEMIKERINELSGLISEEGAVHIIANEMDIKVESEKPKKTLNLIKIEEITEPRISVSFYAKVLRKYDVINFSNEKAEGKVQSILVGDETGITRVTFWNDKVEILENVNEKDVIKIVNAFTRENQGRIEVTYSSYSDIEVNPEGVEIEVKDMRPEVTEKKVTEMEENDRNVRVKGLVTDFDIPRFYHGCPHCFKKLRQENEEGAYLCPSHGEVESIKIPIVNLGLDDGSSNISLVAFRDNAEKITKLNTEDILKLLDQIDHYRNFVKQFLGQKMTVVGNVTKNNLTEELQLNVNSVEENEFEPDMNKVFEKESSEKEKESSDNAEKKEEEKTESDKESSEKDQKSTSNEDSEELKDMDMEEIDVDDI